MNPLAVIVLSAGAFGFAATAIALGVYSGGLRETIAKLNSSIIRANGDAKLTAEEFARYRAVTSQQLESLLDEITDLEDNLDACSDPDFLRDRLSVLLQKASGRAARDSDTSSDELP